MADASPSVSEGKYDSRGSLGCMSSNNSRIPPSLDTNATRQPFIKLSSTQTNLSIFLINPLHLSHQQSYIFPSSLIVSIIPCIWCINIDLAEASSSPLAIFHQASSIKHRPSAIVHQASSIRHRLSRYEHTHHHPSKPVCIGLSQLTLTASLALAIVIITHRSSSVVHRPSSIAHRPRSIICLPSSIVHRPSSIIDLSINTNTTVSNTSQCQSVMSIPVGTWKLIIIGLVPCYDASNVLKSRWVMSAMMIRPYDFFLLSSDGVMKS
jgi:hypothetical protein